MTFALRRALRLSAPILLVPPTDVAAVVAGLPAPARAAAGPLLARHDPAAWRRRVRPWEVAENLYVLALLEAALPPALRRPGVRALDVGCRSWPYLAAQRAAVPGRWDGVELDAHARLGLLWTRAAVARWRTRGLADARFVAGPVEALAGPYDVVTWFLPFLTPGAHRAWGLPAAAFDPPRLLAHVWSLVAPGGALLLTNQGGEEAALQRDLFARAGLRAAPLGALARELSPFERERPAWLVAKGADGA